MPKPVNNPEIVQEANKGENGAFTLGIAVGSEKERISATYGLVGLRKYVDRKKPDRGVPAG